MATTQALPTMGYFRNTGDEAYHLAADWPSLAMCGSAPALRGIGWTLGIPYGAFVAGDLAICPECQDAYRALAEGLAGSAAGASQEHRLLQPNAAEVTLQRFHGEPFEYLIVVKVADALGFVTERHVWGGDGLAAAQAMLAVVTKTLGGVPQIAGVAVLP